MHVLNASTFVEKSCHIFPFEVFLSASSNSNISFFNGLPFFLASWVSIAEASSLFPFRKSHLGDSGIILQANSELSLGKMRII